MRQNNEEDFDSDARLTCSATYPAHPRADLNRKKCCIFNERHSREESERSRKSSY